MIFMDIGETFFAIDRAMWREWLSDNFDKKKEIWIIFNKKHVKEPCMSYDEAVEEALCFGWIDGLMKRLDDRQHVIRFTPRRKRSVWSELNALRFQKMIEQGKMLEVGLKKFDESRIVHSSVSVSGDASKVPEALEKALKQDIEVWKKFQGFSPSHKNQYIGWIREARREETRLKRAQKAFEMIRDGEKHRMMNGSK